MHPFQDTTLRHVLEKKIAKKLTSTMTAYETIHPAPPSFDNRLVRWSMVDRKPFLRLITNDFEWTLSDLFTAFAPAPSHNPTSAFLYLPAPFLSVPRYQKSSSI